MDVAPGNSECFYQDIARGVEYEVEYQVCFALAYYVDQWEFGAGRSCRGSSSKPLAHFVAVKQNMLKASNSDNCYT